MIVVYKINSQPLEVNVNPKKNDIVYSDRGDCYKCCLINGKELLFKKIHDSVLNSGEYLDDLTELQLELFWKLSKTELNKILDNEVEYSV